MASESLLSFFLIFSSFLHLGFSDPNPQDLIRNFDPSNATQFLQNLGKGTGPAANTDANAMQCMQKLLPCRSFLKSQTNPPPTSPPKECCQPLKEMVANDTACICNVFNDPKLLQSFNVTKDDALKLPKACGADADISKCEKEAAAPLNSPATGTANPSPPADSDSKNSTSSTQKITPYGITHFGVPGFAALMATMVFSAY